MFFLFFFLENRELDPGQLFECKSFCCFYSSGSYFQTQICLCLKLLPSKDEPNNANASLKSAKRRRAAECWRQTVQEVHEGGGGETHELKNTENRWESISFTVRLHALCWVDYWEWIAWRRQRPVIYLEGLLVQSLLCIFLKRKSSCPVVSSGMVKCTLRCEDIFW